MKGGQTIKSKPVSASSSVELLENYSAVRVLSEKLAAPLTPEDQQIQSMPDVSPTKWHLAHTTWFFETFILMPHAPEYQEFNSEYGYLFNSYYEAVGPRHVRAERGLLSRPSLDEVMQYRAHVDTAMEGFLSEGHATADQALSELLELGLNHEQQHQELLLMDIKHVLSRNPICPSYRKKEPVAVRTTHPLHWHSVAGGTYTIGYGGTGFCFDNEGPEHQEVVEDFAIGSRAVTNGEYLEFI